MGHDTSEEISEDNGWINTDPDTGQWVKPTDEGFYVREIGLNGGEHIGFFQPTQKSDAELDEIVDGYYDSIDRVREHYPKHWPMIVAEIMSEKSIHTL